MTEKEIHWTTKSDKGKFPKGTEHTKILDPYGLGYEGSIHIHKTPGEELRSHLDLPRNEWRHPGDPFRSDNILGSNLSPMTKIRMLQKSQEQR